MCHPEERGRRAEGSFFVRNIWEALYLERCLRCRHDKQFNVFMSKHSSFSILLSVGHL